MKRLIKGIVKGLLLEMMEGESSKKAAIEELDAYFDSNFPRGGGLAMERREDARATIGASIDILRREPGRNIDNDIFMVVKGILDKHGLLDGEGELALNSIMNLYVMDDDKDILMHDDKVRELLGKGV
jgi:hypothetical protein